MEAKQKNLWHYLFQTEKDSILTFLRIALGVVMFAHGAQKLFGWFGGYGFSGTMGYFTDGLGIPVLFAFLAIMAESIGALFLIGGLLSRVSAFGIGVVMAVAAITSHLQFGFFMNWGGNLAGEGFEFHIIAFAIAFALTIKGGGAFALDTLILQKADEKESNYEFNHAR
jgi:putative oxidoreductase